MTLEKHAATIAAITRLNPYGMIEDGQSRLKEGDLVVRMNRDPSSGFIKYFNHRIKTIRIPGSCYLNMDILTYIIL